jgi:5-methyltetrahydrofolate--homocysteine methyltransferase
MSLDLKSFAAKLRVTDGAWGTQLAARGLPGGECAELWNVAKPEEVLAVARSYVDVGSEVILTNTLCANRFMLQRHDAAGRAAELMEAGAAISRKAAGSAVKVVASVGPTGKIVMMDEVPAADIQASYAEIGPAAEAGGADAIVLETFNELDEMVMALRALKQSCRLPVICSMTFSTGPEKTASTFGTQPGPFAQAVQAAGADVIGANCGIGPENYVRIAELLRAASALPIWIKANAGVPRLGPGGRTIFPMAPAEFAAWVAPLAKAGANFIGGCCGTTPDHIRLVRAAVDKLG